MAGKQEPPSGGENDRQDPYVKRVRPDPGQPATAVVVLEGLLGDSDRAGYKRLYLTRELDYYAHFNSDDVVHTEPVPADQPPFVGLDATRVSIRRDAPIEYIWERAAGAADEFDLDIRLGGAATSSQMAPTGLPQFAPCIPRTNDTCRTDCGQATCDTCRTDCAQATCGPTCNTCGGTCGNTCNTCNTNCNQATCVTCNTCNTCQTRCNQRTCGDTCRTCNTCDTCNPHVFTCGPSPRCNQ